MVSPSRPHCACSASCDPLEVAALPVHVRLLDLDVMQPGRRIELDRAHLGAFADHLPVHLAVGRHVDDDIAQQLRLAGQPAARGQPLAALVALLGRRERAQMLRRAGDPVLGEAALAHRHLAPPADRPPAADAVDVDAQLPRGSQHRRAEREPAALAGGCEDDQRVVHPAALAPAATLVAFSAGARGGRALGR